MTKGNCLVFIRSLFYFLINKSEKKILNLYRIYKFFILILSKKIILYCFNEFCIHA